MGDLSAAEKYLDKSLKIACEKTYLGCQFNALQNLVLLLLKKNDLSRAKEYYREMVSIAEKIDTKETKAILLSISGHMKLKEKCWQRALTSFEKALKIYNSMENPYNSAKMKYYIGLTLSMSARKSESRNRFSDALSTFKKIGAKKWRKRVEHALYNKIPESY